MKKIEIYTIVGENCITRTAGQKVYDLVHSELLSGHSVDLDFEKVRVFASPFFNASIGRLFEDIAPLDFDRLVKVSNLAPANMHVFKQVIQNSKRYYSDKGYREALDATLREQAQAK